MNELQTYPVLILLMVFTVLTSWLAFRDPRIKGHLMYSPYQMLKNKEWGRLIGHPFIHGDWMHLGFNMYVLYIFGKMLEPTLGIYFPGVGGIYFLSLYLGGALFASLPALLRHHNNPSYFSLGASGAVSAILFAFIIIYPDMPLGLFGLPFKFPAWVFGLGYLALEVYLDKRNRPGDNIAHDAHYWGAISGVLFVPLVRWEFIPEFIDKMQLW